MLTVTTQLRKLQFPFLLALALGSVACTPALVDFLPSHTFKIVSAETGEPIPGTAMLLTWQVCAINGSRTAYAWGGVADANGIIRVPVRTVFGNYSIVELECYEDVLFFKSGGWKTVEDSRDLGGLNYGSWSFSKDERGRYVVRLEPIAKDDWGARQRAVSNATSGAKIEFPEAFAPISFERKKEWAEIPPR